MDELAIFIVLMIAVFIVVYISIELRLVYLKHAEEKESAKRRRQFIEENKRKKELREQQKREFEENRKKMAEYAQLQFQLREAERLERIREQEAAEQKRRHEYQQVELYSLRYRKLRKMFDAYDVKSDFRTSFHFSYVFHSRRAFDDVKELEALRYLSYENDELKNAYDCVKKNRSEIERFMDENSVPKQSPQSAILQSGIPEDRFIEIEKELCNRLKTRAVIDLEIELYLYYRAGGDHSLKTYKFNFDDLEKAYQIRSIPDIEYTSTQEEREKMTPSLRYSILQRDGFRCSICGATANDGVKLHVDHIMPVSKGGKTEPGNLRTLCDRCNMGKGARYNPDGIN